MRKNKLNFCLTAREREREREREQTAGITQINESVAQIDQTTKDNVEIANESAIISSTVSDIANNILEDVKKKRF